MSQNMPINRTQASQTGITAPLLQQAKTTNTPLTLALIASTAVKGGWYVAKVVMWPVATIPSGLIGIPAGIAGHALKWLNNNNPFTSSNKTFVTEQKMFTELAKLKGERQSELDKFYKGYVEKKTGLEHLKQQDPKRYTSELQQLKNSHKEPLESLMKKHESLARGAITRYDLALSKKEAEGAINLEKAVGKIATGLIYVAEKTLCYTFTITKAQYP